MSHSGQLCCLTITSGLISGLFKVGPDSVVKVCVPRSVHLNLFLEQHLYLSLHPCLVIGKIHMCPLRIQKESELHLGLLDVPPWTFPLVRLCLLLPQFFLLHHFLQLLPCLMLQPCCLLMPFYSPCDR